MDTHLSWDSSYYDEQQGHVRGALIAVETRLPSASADLLHELVDANESGVAVTFLSSYTLVLTDHQAGDLWALDTHLQVEPDIFERLSHLCRRPGQPTPASQPEPHRRGLLGPAAPPAGDVIEPDSITEPLNCYQRGS